ncbi:hypothetical protein FOA52_007955 [Chlamydomonas sp. UWO 241]|nr:hypothetical protein FOA52_007955 [Chlamydomonas sp. UWO 241]
MFQNHRIFLIWIPGFSPLPQEGKRAAMMEILRLVGWQLPGIITPAGWRRGRPGLRSTAARPAPQPAAAGGGAAGEPRWVGFAQSPGVVGKLTCKLAVALQLLAVVDERRVRRAATVEAALALDHGQHRGPRASDVQVCAGLRGLEAAVPALWRVPLLKARKEPIWRLWVWLLQPPPEVRPGVWAVVAALVVDAMERGRCHLWRITRPRDGVVPPARSVAVERAGALATIDLFVLSIPVARGANWFLAGGGRRMDEEEATAAAAERIAAAAEDGTSLPVRLATDVVRFLYGGTGRREPADGGVVSASLLNAKPAVGGIGVEPRGGGVLRVLFTVASDAVADTVVRWRHELRRCVDSTAVFDVLSDCEEAQHQALWPAFLAAKVAGKRAQFHRARLVVDGERIRGWGLT